MTGAIGKVREVHVWAERAWGLQDAASAEKSTSRTGSTTASRSSTGSKKRCRSRRLCTSTCGSGRPPARPYHATYFPGPRWYRCGFRQRHDERTLAATTTTWHTRCWTSGSR